MNLLTISELDKEQITTLLERAALLKERHKSGIPYHPLRGKTLALVFSKASTRTRVSFETAMFHLGGNAIFISHRDSQVGRGEPIKDTARVMSRYVDAVVIRTFGHEIIEEYASYSDVPVINGLTDMHHPCQVLADLLTIKENRGTLKGLKIAWIGDGNNMANSWVEAAVKCGFDLTLASPPGYELDEAIISRARADADGEILQTSSVAKAAEGADVLNTDVWASMGQEEEQRERIKSFKDYQINNKTVALANKNVMVMHCLPAHRGEEITEDVLEGSRSVVFDQAENRLHIQKAILEWLMLPHDA